MSFDPLDSYLAGILLAVFLCGAGWGVAILGLFSFPVAPWLVVVPFPGLLQALWVAPLATLLWSQQRAKTALGLLGAAGVLAVANVLVLFAFLPDGRLF